ncbi:MAG: TRAP transporter permease DctQ [Tistrella sp.]|jgi:TRAP-type C4-dicarboxylate transport system permease small subunit|uniref:TRAP transporter small permease protein n=1 Tax=Tistrella mobilis TaxID=171437 RepID=A0A3B9IH66_9PROT|nr:TRAP transporter small permease [Tistrella sp.]MAD38977.1 TRAP transporter permease DctQ [Tistrella sp.]MBA74792.1 TRAP transporter permease DctQ [Tistrella sp.]HAE47058.1 TRAP transporter small permease [Tistrella mobilis]
MSALLQTLSRGLARVTGWVIVAITTVMMVSLILQVFSRYVLGQGFTWTEELALFLFTWVVLLAATTAIRDDGHVRLQLVIDLLPGAARRIWMRVLTLAVLIFCVVFAVTGAEYVSATLGQVSAAVQYPIEALHMAAPVAGVLGAIHALARLLAPQSVIDGTPETGGMV